MTEQESAKIRHLQMSMLFSLCGGSLQMFAMNGDAYADKVRTYGGTDRTLPEFKALAAN
jgi:hypothetical protein